MTRWLRKLMVYLVLLTAVILACYGVFREKYSTVVGELAQTQVKNATSDLTNDAIARQIANGNIAYDRIVYFEKDLNGRITALKTNISEVNRLKTDILNIINDEILAWIGYCHSPGQHLLFGAVFREGTGDPGAYPVGKERGCGFCQ